MKVDISKVPVKFFLGNSIGSAVVTDSTNEENSKLLQILFDIVYKMSMENKTDFSLGDTMKWTSIFVKETRLEDLETLEQQGYIRRKSKLKFEIVKTPWC